MALSSKTSVEIEIEIEGIGTVKGELKKYMAPMTFNELVKRMPISGPLAIWENAVYLLTEVKRGAEKVVERVEAGDILYWPPAGAIVFVHKDGPAPNQAVRIGKLSGDPSILRYVKGGARATLRPLG